MTADRYCNESLDKSPIAPHMWSIQNKNRCCFIGTSRITPRNQQELVELHMRLQLPEVYIDSIISQSIFERQMFAVENKFEGHLESSCRVRTQKKMYRTNFSESYGSY